MAEVRNNFLKSRMNRDLDARLVPSGEYREAFNVMISKSEGEDVGALENVLGNLALDTWGADYSDCNISIIGKYMDVVNDRIIVFMTNFVDTSGDNLSNFASSNSLHAIGVHNILSGESQIIVSGRFLNFSKTHEVYGVNLIEDLLFWTDNRNQPRKINLRTAIADNTYYQSEDNISVAKIYPHQPILLYKEQVTGLTISQAGAGDGTAGSGFTVAEPSCKTTTISGSGSGMTVNINDTSGGGVTAVSIAEPGTGYANGDVIQLIPRVNPVSGTITQQCQVTIVTSIVSTMQDVVSETLPDGTSNPLYNKNWPGDKDYLKDKFVRFSYRFKFDDDEYSLIAPFTQECFVPKQDGYFIGDDEDRTYKSTEVAFMENKINNILLQIPSPSGNTWNQVDSDLKIVEMDILMKQAGETSIRVVDTIPSNIFNLSTNLNYEYEYQSLKPYKTLPEKDLTRVFDQVPVRALSQEVSANRVIYGNFVDKPTPPETINYNVSADTKDTLTLEKEYQNHTLKQNRTYQVGVVLSDRYGRQSTTLLSKIDNSSTSSTLKGSTLFHAFKESPFSTYPNTSAEDLLTASDTWPGDSLKVTFIDQILSDKSSVTGAPGLYSATNPLGWYSYKIVVKQQEQDYYNVYFPGILNGYINGDMKHPFAASANEPIAHFALYSDNINKVPRDLSLVGPNQNIFRSGRPSFSEDPDYYKWRNTDGELFDIDPYTVEGERLLSFRDRVRDLDSGSQVTNASIQLSLRVNNNSGSTTQQWYPGTNTDLVTTIGTGQDLGLWDPSSITPFNIAPVFYNYEDNPYIARVNTSDFTVGKTGPSPYAGNLWFSTPAPYGAGTNYVAGSRNVNVELPNNAPAGAGTGIQVDIWAVSGGGSPTSIGISNEGEGWDLVNGSYPMTIGPCKILAGDNNATFNLVVSKMGYSTVTNGASLLDSITQNFVGATPATLVNQEPGVTAGVTTSSSNGSGLKLNFTVNLGGIITVITVSDPGEGFIPGDTITLDRTTFGGTQNAIITLRASDFDNMSPILTVYETKPLESKLDIYWETSTSGLISELNTAIVSGGGSDPNTPGSLRSAGGDVTSLVTEGTLIQGSTTDVTGDFTAYTPAGVSLATEVLSTTLVSAIDRIGSDWTSFFNTASGSGAGLYKITSNTGIYYGSTSNSHHDWTFTVRVVVKSSTWALDGTTITTDLPLQGNPFRMLNVAPSFSLPLPFIGGAGSGTSATGGNVYNAVATNGSGTTALKGFELNWSIFSVIDNTGTNVTSNGYFTLTPNGTTQNAALDAVAGLPVGSYNIRLKVIDGGGLNKKSSIITIIIT